MAKSKPGGIVGAVSPARGFIAVTPAVDDATDFTDGICRALYVGTAGNVAAVSADSDTVVFVAVNAGSVLPIQCRRVNATSTTADDIVALY